MFVVEQNQGRPSFYVEGHYEYLHLCVDSTSYVRVIAVNNIVNY